MVRPLLPFWGCSLPLSKAAKLQYAETVRALLKKRGPLRLRRVEVETGLGWETLLEIFGALGAAVSGDSEIVTLPGQVVVTPGQGVPAFRLPPPGVRWGPLRSGDWNGIGGIHRLRGGNYGHQEPSPDGRLVP
jgi:hypothetical protein